jgi:hypothetical protein
LSDVLCLQSNSLTLLESGRAALQAVCAGQKLLSLLQMFVLWVICVAITEKRFTVVGKRFELALCFI